MSQTPVRETITKNYIDGLLPFTFMEDPKVKSRFIYLATGVMGDTNVEEFYEQQANFFKRALMDNNKLTKCTLFSLYNCFIDIPLLNMTLDKNANLLYFEIRGHNTQVKDQQGKDIYEDRASLKITPYGELALRMDLGQIKYIDNPVVCYEQDSITIEINDLGNKIIRYKAQIPRKRGRIIFGFVKLTRPDDSFDYFWMEEEDIDRLKKYSQRNSSKWVNGQKVAGDGNALYSGEAGIDKGFFEAKLIKHAFRSFPKMRVKGTNSSLDDDGQGQENVFVNENASGESNQPPAGVSATAPQHPFEDKVERNEPVQEDKKKKTITFESDDF